MSKLINRIAAVAALALAATPIVGLTAAHAAGRPEQIARIPVGDLRLSNPVDAAEFVRRTKEAGDAFCTKRQTDERLGRLSKRACILDFNNAVAEELTKSQRADLRMARKTDRTVLALR